MDPAPNGNGGGFDPRGGVPDVPELAPHAGPEPGGMVIRTMNQNMGAIRTALPRQLDRIMLQIRQQAAYFGHQWEYAIPFKDRRTGRETLVTGPTIKCANAVARAFGNCTVGVDKIEETPGSWIIHAVFTDIEAGVQFQRPFRQRREANIGGYGGDRGRTEDITFQIGASKALRNVVVNALGDLIAEAIYEGKKALTARIEKDPERALGWVREKLAEYEIPEARIVRAYATPIEKLRPVHLAQVVKLLQAVEDGALDPAEVFPGDTTRPGAAADLREQGQSEHTDPYQPQQADAPPAKAEAPRRPRKPAPAEAPAVSKGGDAEAPDVGDDAGDDAGGEPSMPGDPDPGPVQDAEPGSPLPPADQRAQQAAAIKPKGAPGGLFGKV